ncbi:hypothetical protein HU200_029113 [Digitaria exilis]|uniref:Uncharacterized protein n=1 Tax=Digitaria exilis TaxID=1010633 RepID=A0A835C1V8_9POAL|nr:hypothetical protein HU200_029113 [Digitaria exilis]
MINDDVCERTCQAEADNISGYCEFFQCWCLGRCTSSETAAAAASSPIPA